MNSKKLPYKEGDWFVVPLKSGGYALGLIARLDGKGSVLGYFFGPGLETVDSSSINLNRDPNEAIFICKFGDLGRLKGTWNIIHTLKVPWDWAAWSVLAFAHINHELQNYQRREYNASNPFGPMRIHRVSPEELEGLPEDGLWGAGAVEIQLTKLLKTSSVHS